MAWITKAAANTLVAMLKAQDGLSASLFELEQREKLHLPEFDEERIHSGSVPADQPGRPRYPQVAVYCERLVNEQREKFRKFSGTARLVIDLEASGERADLTEQHLHLYAEAVSDVLERNLGDWGNGLFYGGKYEVEFKSVKSGGRNYTQAARFELDVASSEPFRAG